MRTVSRRAFASGLPLFESRSKTAADRAQGHSHKELERLGLKVQKEPELKWLIDGWRKDTVAKLKGFTDHQIKRIGKILERGENRPIDSIADDLKEQIDDISDRHAEYIARNAVVSLSNKINRHRMRAARVEQYAWTTQGDDRVRDEHDELDGELFDVDGDGDDEEGHPGDAPNCRCMSFPVAPDDDDVEDDDADED